MSFTQTRRVETVTVATEWLGQAEPTQTVRNDIELWVDVFDVPTVTMYDNDRGTLYVPTDAYVHRSSARTPEVRVRGRRQLKSGELGRTLHVIHRFTWSRRTELPGWLAEIVEAAR